MKKFSNISGSKVGEFIEPKEVKLNEKDIFKSKVMSLMDQFLTIRTYGPVDRYQRAGTIKISGKEEFLEAMISIMTEKSLKEQAKLLEGLKANVKDWDVIDERIESINSKIVEDSDNISIIKHKNKILSIYNNYKDDNDMLFKMIDESVSKIKSDKVLKMRALASESISMDSKYPTEIFKEISEKYYKNKKDI